MLPSRLRERACVCVLLLSEFFCFAEFAWRGICRGTVCCWMGLEFLASARSRCSCFVIWFRCNDAGLEYSFALQRSASHSERIIPFSHPSHPFIFCQKCHLLISSYLFLETYAVPGNITGSNVYSTYSDQNQLAIQRRSTRITRPVAGARPA